MRRDIVCYILVLLVTLAAGPAVADDDDHARGGTHHEREHDDDEINRDALREAVRQGHVKPLAEILQIVTRTQPGDVTGVEVERKGSAWIYEIRIVDPSGHLIEVKVDAATGQTIEREDH